MPNFLRERAAPANTSGVHSHLHSPNPLKPALSPQPQHQQQLQPQINTNSIYTSPTASFSKPFKKLKVMMSPQRKDIPLT